MNIDKKTEKQGKIDITDFLNLFVQDAKEIRKKLGKEPKEFNIEEMLHKFREAGINATYCQL